MTALANPFKFSELNVCVEIEVFALPLQRHSIVYLANRCSKRCQGFFHKLSSQGVTQALFCVLIALGFSALRVPSISQYQSTLFHRSCEICKKPTSFNDILISMP